MNAPNRVEDGTNSSAQFVIVAVVKALQIDLVEIEPGTQVFEHLGRAVAVGNEAGEEPRSLGLFKNSDGPFAGDQWFVVRADQHLGTLIDCVANKLLGRCFERWRNGVGIAKRL